MLVGGKGTRLRPLTLSAPKPLLPTAGVPFLAHQLTRAAECGITHVVLATSYRAEMFTEAFGTGEDFGLSIDYVHESEPLGTGGGIRNAAALLRGGPDDPIVVLNGDVLTGHDLPAQVDLHRKKDAAVTLHLVPVEDPSRYGCVPTDSSGRVTAFLEKTPNPVTNQINAGCYVFRRSVIDTIPAGQVVSVERETFPGLIASGAVVMGYAEAAYWLDVGTPEAFVRGSCDVVLGALHSPALGGTPGVCLVLGDARVAPDAQLSGGTTVGYGAVIQAGAIVSGSVVFDGASIGAGAVVRDSIIGRDATIVGGALLDGVVIGDGAYVGPGNELTRGLRLWPGARLEDTSVRFSSDA
ncbi:NDP-sugar synthase [Trebonia kvetii]|uniref:NDP-sugar synthase n=2 Tax=Trebonia kvetii TaxID=2480626 RepID=A0A6P2C7U1_9ACTN|nr:NDP-sugar synthase [Trebonia kvetii]